MRPKQDGALFQFKFNSQQPERLAMKSYKIYHVTMGLMLLAYPIVITAQSSTIPWSSFAMGAGVSTIENTAVVSAVGQELVGITGADSTQVASGLLVILRQRIPLAIDEPEALPAAYALHQNYPNPFNPTTTLDFDLPEMADIRLTVYDILGREVVRLVDRRMEAGFHQLVWNGRDRMGRELSTGTYIVLMQAAGFRKSIKVVLLK